MAHLGDATVQEQAAATGQRSRSAQLDEPVLEEPAADPLHRAHEHAPESRKQGVLGKKRGNGGLESLRRPLGIGPAHECVGAKGGGLAMREHRFEKAVHGGGVLVAITEMVLPDLRGRIAHGLEELGDRWISVLKSLPRSREPDFQQSGAER